MTGKNIIKTNFSANFIFKFLKFKNFSVFRSIFLIHCIRQRHRSWTFHNKNGNILKPQICDKPHMQVNTVYLKQIKCNEKWF